MIDFDDVTKGITKEHSPNLLQIPNHPYRILIVEGSGSGKMNALLNLIKRQDDDNDSVINRKVYMLKIHMKQNTNCSLTNKKVLV